ncbi:putative reverse transcriptase, partial [Operophtera brumata]
MMRIRDEALSEYRKLKTDVKRDYYQSLKSLVKQSFFHEKSAYYKHYINNQTYDSKTLWKNLKTNLLPPKKQNEQHPRFTDADEINRHFLNVPGRVENDSIFTINTVSFDNILKILGSLKSNAEGYDHLNMLLLTFPQTLEAITQIVNASIKMATYPE